MYFFTKFCLAECLQFTLFSYLWITSLSTQMLTMGTERLLLYSDYYSGVFMPVCCSSIHRWELTLKLDCPLTHMKFWLVPALRSETMNRCFQSNQLQINIMMQGNKTQKGCQSSSACTILCYLLFSFTSLKQAQWHIINTATKTKAELFKDQKKAEEQITILKIITEFKKLEVKKCRGFLYKTPN